MTITKQNTCEGGTNGVAVATNGTNTGGASGDAFPLASYPSGGSLIFDAASKTHGSLGLKFVNTAPNQALVRWTGFSDVTGVMRVYASVDTLPSSGNEPIIGAYTSTGAIVVQVALNSAGKYVLLDSTGGAIAGGTTTASYQAGDRIEMDWTIATATTGAVNLSIYRGDATAAVESKNISTANLGTTNWDRMQFGKLSTTAYVTTIHMDDFAAASGTTARFGVPQIPPTASFLDSEVALTLTVDGSASSAYNLAPLSSYDWDWGDGTAHGSGVTPGPHTYAADGTYTVVLTVTDSNGKTSTASRGITVAGPAATVTAQAILVGTNWTPSSGTALGCITDADPTTYVSSASPPTNQEFDILLHAVKVPSPGQPLKLFLPIDTLTATSGTLTAQLFEGATQRSPAAGLGAPIAIAAGSGTSVGNQVTLTFPWSDVQNVSTGGWNALTLKLQVTAS